MPSDDYLLSILATFKDSASPELKKFGQAVLGAGKATGQAGKQTTGFGDKLTVLGAKFMSITGAAQQAGQMFQQAFDFAEMGAQSIQTAASFEVLLEKVGAAPDLLDELRTSSRNTIPDLDLMASTSTLLAGAQGELATALAGSTPKLMEIAKAANAINPSLGDTNFLYQSLATGIKRASPMILDNLGLMIKVGEANERFAEAAGKSVDQLTAEEQKMALLNETMRAGQVLIEQAGDNIDSVTDDFARFETAIDNAKTAMAEMAVPVLAPLLEQLTDLFTISEREATAIDKAKKAMEGLAETSEEYAEGVRERLILEGMVEGETRKAMEGRLAVMKDGNIAILGFAAQAIASQRKFVGTYIATNKRLGLSTVELEKRYDELTQQLEDYADGVIELDFATTELGAEQAEQQAILEEQVQSYYQAGDAVEILGDETTKMAIAARKAKDETDDLGISVRQSGDMFNYAEDQLWRVVNAEEAAKIAARELREDQLLLSEAFGELATQMRGAVSEEQEDYIESTARAQEKVEGLRQKVADLKAEPSFPTDEQQEQLAEYREEIDEEVASLDELAVAHREAMNSVVFDLVMTRIAQENWGDAGLELATTLAESMGLVDDETAAMMRGINTTLGEFDKDRNIARARREVQWLTGDFTAAGAAAEVAGSDMARQRIGEGFMREGVAPVSAFDEMKTEIEDLVEPEYELQFTIPDRDFIIESVAILESMTRYLEGKHTISFNVKASGEFPGAGPADGGGGGGAPATVTPGGRAFPVLQFGGLVESSGLAFVEAGELIIPPMEAQQMQQGGGGTTIAETNNEFNLNVTSVQEMTSLIQEFEMMRAMVG